MIGRFYYDYEDPNGAKIMDLKEGKNYPLETIGDFRKITDLMNQLSEEKCLITDENGHDYVVNKKDYDRFIKEYPQAEEWLSNRTEVAEEILSYDKLFKEFKFLTK